MKILKGIFLVIIVIIVALVAFYFFMGGILKKGITTAGPAVMGVPIELESIAADPIRGKVEVEKLIIHNASEFKTAYAFKIDSFKFAFEPLSALGDTIHIEEITIDGATIISDGLAADNHRQILKNIQKGQTSKKSESPEKSSNEKPAKAKKVIIDHFTFKNSALQIIVEGEEITKVDFPKVELEQIGTKGNAITVSEALAQIYTAIASETTHVLTVNDEVIKNLAKAKLKKLGINNPDDLKHPEKILKDPEALGNILNALTNSKNSGNGG